MAVNPGPPPVGLVRSFAEFRLLCGLLRYPTSQWPRRLANLPSTPRTDHFEAEEGKKKRDKEAERKWKEKIAGDMASDARQLCHRIGLFKRDEALTNAGFTLAGINLNEHGSLGREGNAKMGDVLAVLIRRSYVGDGGINIVDLLQAAAENVAGDTGAWRKYCPGILLGELRHLLALCFSNADAARSLAEELPRMRIEALGRAKPRADHTKMESLDRYATAIQEWHLDAISALREAEPGGTAVPDETEGRATALLLDQSGLLNLLHVWTPVHCLGPPSGGWPRSPLDPPPLTMGDVGGNWDVPHQAGAIAKMMAQLAGRKFKGQKWRVFPNLGIDNRSRKALGMPLPTPKGKPEGDEEEVPTKARSHNWINKALSMELLTGLLLSRLDSADEVTCHCETKNGRPFNWAPPGRPDVEAGYYDPPPGFRVVAEVTVDKSVGEGKYVDQLEQAYKFAQQASERSDGLPVYAVVMNLGEIGSDKSLQETFASFVESKRQEPGGSGAVTMVPIYAGDFACAVEDLEGLLSPEAFRFPSSELREVFNRLAADALLEPKGKRPDDWGRRIFHDVVIKGAGLGGSGPRRRGGGPSGP